MLDDSDDMTPTGKADNNPVLTVTKKGRLLELSRDPHPQSDRYMAIAAPGMLVLFAKEGSGQLVASNEARPESVPLPSEVDRDSQLRRAFAALEARVSPSAWTSSNQPYSDLVRAFDDLNSQADVRADVSTYLERNPSVDNAVEMLFTSVAMSARADWRSAPASMRAVAARGWFLGRWLPTFLVLDGPIMRFLMSEAFRRQTGSPVLVRAVRAFFSNRDFMLLRHAFAHWSFSWRINGDDSEIVALGSSEEACVSRAEADAFHIITFALVEAIHQVFLKDRQAKR